MTHDNFSDERLDPDILEREGLDAATVQAVGKVSEARETVEVARGLLYQFHRMTGTADFQLGEAARLLRKAGHDDLADEVETEMVGRNVLPGRWTFQVVEGYDETYYEPLRDLQRRSLDLVNGHAHLFEAGLKRERRTTGEPGHEAEPNERG
ncbi:MAG: hypothetical protein ACJ72O_10575 [Marmoricola sp.]